MSRIGETSGTNKNKIRKENKVSEKRYKIRKENKVSEIFVKFEQK